jgi:photosystem II stability/assembly factor-like uncharacterized protein
VLVAVGTPDGVFHVDLEEEEIVDVDADATVEPETVAVELPRAVTAARSGSTVVAVVDRRPPLVVSHDAGITWRESGGGLPGGQAVAVALENPDLVVYGARNRLYVSRDGGRFWAALRLELPEILALELHPPAS